MNNWKLRIKLSPQRKLTTTEGFGKKMPKNKKLINLNNKKKKNRDVQRRLKKKKDKRKLKMIKDKKNYKKEKSGCWNNKEFKKPNKRQREKHQKQKN